MGQLHYVLLFAIQSNAVLVLNQLLDCITLMSETPKRFWFENINQ